MLASGWLAVFILGGERIEALHYERGDGDCWRKNTRFGGLLLMIG